MTEVRGLIINLEARTAQLERGLKRANDAQRKAARQMEQRAKQSAERMQAAYAKMPEGITAAFGKLKGLALPFAGGFLGGMAAGGVAGIVSNLGRVTRAVAEIGNEAKRAGVSAEVFQEWMFVADQNRISVDALVDGFKELSLRADEFIQTGVGPAAEAFNRLGFRAEDLKRKLADPSALMLDILGKLERFDKAAQIRIADEIFGGTGGERFVELLGQGQGALRDTIQRAHETGAVLDEELIAKAEELDRKFSELSVSVGNFGKRAAVALAEAAVEVTDLRARLDKIFDTEPEGRAILGDEVYDALAADRDMVEQQAEALKLLNSRYSALGDEARAASSSLLAAVSQLDAWGYGEQASALAGISAEMRDLAGEFDAGRVSAGAFTTRMSELERAATEAFSALEAGDRVSFGGVMSQLTRLGSVIAGVIGLADQLTGALEQAAGVDPASKAAQALRARHEAEAASVASYEAMRAANEAFTASETARNVASTEALRLEREVAAVKTRASKAGASLTDQQAHDMASAALGGEAARVAADRAARSAGGSSREKADDFAREALAIRDKTLALQAEAAVLASVAMGQRRNGDAMEFARAKAELLVAAQKAGTVITPEVEAGIDAMAQSYADMAASADKARQAVGKVQQDAQRGGDALADLFMRGIDGADALKSALLDLAKTILRNQLAKLLGGLPGAGALGGLLAPGFAFGGYTGDGPKFKPAGIVHKGEFVFSKETVQRLGAENLHRLHQSARKGYASGGLVGDAGKAVQAVSARSGDSGGASGVAFTINAPVTVNATGGTPEANADLARKIAAETEASMRAVVQSEVVRMMRPGGALNAGR